MPNFFFAIDNQDGSLTDLFNGSLGTLLQVSIPSGKFIHILGWGITFAGQNTVEVPAYAYLVESNVAATGGGSATGMVQSIDAPAGQASIVTMGTSDTSTGAYTSEGTITACRFFDTKRVLAQYGFATRFPPDVRPKCGHETSGRFVRVRTKNVTFVATTAWIEWKEE